MSIADTIRDLPDAVLEALATCPVTGAATRPFGEHLIRRCDPRGVVTLLVDLDGLKQLNDSQGHDAGDRMLAGAVAILRANTRPGDIVTRLGGDEFLVTFHTADPLADWPDIELRFRQLFDGRHVVVASVGCAPGNDRTTADTRMYEAKRARKHAHPTMPSRA